MPAAHQVQAVHQRRIAPSTQEHPVTLARVLCCDHALTSQNAPKVPVTSGTGKLHAPAAPMPCGRRLVVVGISPTSADAARSHRSESPTGSIPAGTTHIAAGQIWFLPEFSAACKIRARCPQQTGRQRGRHRMFEAFVLKVLISSPGDTVDEVAAVKESLHGWNGSRAESAQVILLPRHWKSDAVPRVGTGGGQGVINRQLVRRRHRACVVRQSSRAGHCGGRVRDRRRDSARDRRRKACARLVLQ